VAPKNFAIKPGKFAFKADMKEGLPQQQDLYKKISVSTGCTCSSQL